MRASLEDALSSKRWVIEYYDPLSCPKTLLEALQYQLPHIPCDSWPERIAFGGVFLNGERVYGDRALTPPARLEYFEPKYDYLDPASFFPQFDPQWIIHDDGYLLGVFKPAGLPTIANKDQRTYNLKSYLERHFGHRVHLPSRLDSSTSGLILASKHPSFHGKLQRLFERHLIEKTYLLGVQGEPQWQSVRVTLPISRDISHPVLRKTSLEGGLSAETLFEKRASDQQHTLIAAYPKTGRTHQIRVHIAAGGFPIVGDQFYGGAASEHGLELTSFATRFIHPVFGRSFSLNLPDSLLPTWMGRFKDWGDFPSERLTRHFCS